MLDERSEVETLRQVYYLTDGASGNWHKLLALGDCIDQQLKRKLLWMWPSLVDLDYFNQLLAMHDIQRILSIGCGSGLLEWLMTASGGRKVSMFGLEIDRNWWQSKYAIRSFIPLNYVEDYNQLNTDLLSRCCNGTPPSALLFCYFNNRGAFLDYLKVFTGKWLILIGPLPTLGIHTDPNPLQPQLPADEWTLRERLNWTDHNIVTFYEKII
ncbi:uncharacterized protein LOC108105634 [Drosophila eugracilis]|uniref:uncharacterized protein LOC108105634 n=1 Tax=Drosophila eugracilis TaxID=29029 RepID=UPI001BDA91F0|nr:uncharacterized protein LOC108105634 [Drosophila eugracilis]